MFNVFLLCINVLVRIKKKIVFYVFYKFENSHFLEFMFLTMLMIQLIFINLMILIIYLPK